jgi:glycerophosphoryl diester phosphodiesterase
MAHVRGVRPRGCATARKYTRRNPRLPANRPRLICFAAQLPMSAFNRAKTMLRRWLGRLLLALLTLLAAIYLAQLPFRAAASPEHFELIAHRGVHQTFHTRDLTNDTCTAARIDPPRHAFLENSLPSMQAAIDAGASAIEIDVHQSADRELVVWHDWSVDCRTEGHGETRSLTLAQLQTLDAGYGYSADAGRSFPFRGKGVGMIRSLAQVLDAFPQMQFIIDQKDRNPATTALISALLQARGDVARVCLNATPELNQAYWASTGAGACTLASRQAIKHCLLQYLRSGWTGTVPDDCVGQRLVVPDWALVRLLWGWPGTFIERIHAAGGRVYVWTDDPSRFAALRQFGIDGIFTDRIEEFASVVSRQ